MSSSCSHDHSSCNHHGSGDTTNHQNDIIKKLTTATWLCLAFLIIEVIGGYLAGSLAILSDAAHLFADLASFAVAVVAARLASLPTTPQHTFGLKRAESLAALLSMLSLAVVSIGLALEAMKRLYKNEGNVDGKMMTILATIGVIVNVALAMVLGVENHVHLPGAAHHHGHDHGHDHQGHENDHHHCSKGKDHHHGHDENHHHCSKGDDDHHHEEKTDHDHHTHSHSSHCEDHHHHHHHHDAKEENDEESHNHNHSHDNKTITESTSLLGDKEEKKSTITKKKKSSTNVNLQAAYLHVMGDLAQSFGVLIAGLLIWYNPNWYIMDPICTLIFCSVVFYSTLGVIRSSVSVLLEEVPSNVKWIEIFNAVQNVNGVTNVHDLHIWSISQGMPSMSVHCSVNEDSDVALKRIYDAVKAKGIQHATIQIQIGKDCITCTQPCNNEAGMNHIV